MLLNGSTYPRISPTSFYPLLAGAATDAQAKAMIGGWLTNASRFCVPPNASAWPPPPPLSLPPPPTPSPPRCYWGVPSIAADDPSYMVAGGTSGIYWRGENWSPQAFLVALALRRYDHLPEARAARAGLATQQLALMLSVWRPRHDVCENFPSVAPNATSDAANACTGNRFYVWGALPALMALMESGGGNATATPRR